MAKGKHARKRAKQPVKMPLSREGGAVAKRAAKKVALQAQVQEGRDKKKKGGAIQFKGCLRPLRLKRNGSRKRKRDADKEQTRRLRTRLYPEELTAEDFSVEFALVLDERDIENLAQHRTIGGNGVPED